MDYQDPAIIHPLFEKKRLPKPKEGNKSVEKGGENRSYSIKGGAGGEEGGGSQRVFSSVKNEVHRGTKVSSG